MKTRKFLCVMLCLAMLLAVIPAIAPAASAATTKTIYLKPNDSYWNQAGAWFDAWVWGSTQADAWYTFTDANYDGVYETQVPSDATGMKILRKNPASSAHNWDSWNSTGDLTIGTNNCFNITSWSGGSWSTFTPTVTEPVFTVAGSAGLCGSEWVQTDTANDMTMNASGLYEKVYTNVAAGTYEFKVLANHAWTYSWGANGGSNNASVTVAEAGSTVTITFNETTKAVTATVTVPLPELKFSAASLEVSEGISINFKASVDLFGSNGYDLSSSSAAFVFNKGTESERTFTTSTYKTSTDGKYYVFQLYNIRPDWMGDTVTATLTATYNGETISSDPIDYSVATYCYNKLNDSTSTDMLKTLIVDMLNYGAAAQKYTNYKTGALVTENEAYTNNASLGTSTTPTLSGAPVFGNEITDPTAAFKGAALYLRETARIRLTFTAESIENVTVTAAVDGGSTYELNSFIDAGNGSYYVFFDDLKANQMRDDVIFTVLQNGTAISNTLTYSVEAYAAAATQTAGALADMLNAMINYGDSVTAYGS